MWFTGVVAGSAVVLGLLMDRRLTPRTAAPLMLVPVLSTCAAALTPVGPKLLLAPLATNGAAQFITEWEPPNFREPTPAVAAVMLVLVILAWGRASRTSWSHLLLLVVAIGWTVLSLRTVTLGAVMAAPLLSSALYAWKSGAKPPAAAGREPAFLLVTLLVGLLALTIAVPRVSSESGPLAPGVDEALERMPRGTVVFNEYALGGWLVWEHRNVSPVIDGMSDAYAPSYLARYVAASKLKDGWRAFVRDTDAEYALLYPESPLATELEDHMGWRPVAANADHVLLRRTEALGAASR